MVTIVRAEQYQDQLGGWPFCTATDSVPSVRGVGLNNPPPISVSRDEHDVKGGGGNPNALSPICQIRYCEMMTLHEFPFVRFSSSGLDHHSREPKVL
jgi:hypothetical protein